MTDEQKLSIMRKDARYRAIWPELWAGQPTDPAIVRAGKPRVDIVEMASKRKRCGQAKAAGLPCTEFAAATPVTPATTPPPAIHTRHLLYHVYPVAGGMWKWNVEQLLARINLFNGRKVIAVVTDPPDGRKADPQGKGGPSSAKRQIPPTDPVESVLAAFSSVPGVEFILMENDPTLREVKPFLPLFSTVAGFGAGHAAFYGQAKGVTYQHAPTIKMWTELLYATCLDYWPVVERLLQAHAMAGPFKKVGHGWLAEQSKSDWHYSGSFFWLDCGKVFSRPNWRAIDPFWSGIESWPSVPVRAHEAACIFHEGRVGAVNMYNHDYLTNTVLPAWQQWQAEHASERKEWPS